MDSHRNKHFKNFINCHCLLQIWLGYSSCPAQKPWAPCLSSCTQDMCWSHPRDWSRHSSTPVFKTRIPIPLMWPVPSAKSPHTGLHCSTPGTYWVGPESCGCSSYCCWDCICFSSCPQHPSPTAVARPNSLVPVSPAAGTSNLQHSSTG